MAKARVTTNPIYEGGAGGYSFYSRLGEQIMRQRRNNSNYGEGASRSLGQQTRRVKWSNLVNFYKVNRFWMPKAFETRRRGQTDYNRFMQVNSILARYALTKAQAALGCCAVDAYVVAQGSLPSIGYVADAPAGYETTISVGDFSLEDATVGQFSQAVIANNDNWLDGDNLALVLFDTSGDSESNPHTTVQYYEVTLDTTSTEEFVLPIQEDGGLSILRGKVGLAAAVASANSAFVFIHTRKVSGSLQVSTQRAVMTSTAWESLADAAAFTAAIASYGLDVTVPLDPGAL